jgi:regulator of RNase E activity RraA
MTAGAQSRGAIGVVISGYFRDVKEQKESRFPLFSRGHSTLGQSKFTRPSAIEEPLIIKPQPENSAFPSVIIEPGDMIVGDIDGVVCVPKQLVNEVINLATEGREIDERCLGDIKLGLGVKATFEKYRGRAS